MEQWVVDASVLIQAFVEDAETEHVFALLHTIISPASAELHVPEFCLLECANVLWKRAHLEPDQEGMFVQALQNLLDLPLIYHLAAPMLPRAFQVGLAHNLAIYDSLYVALAENLNCPLVTVDRRQADAASRRGVTLKPITDFSAATL